jgi:hypothetical protein
MYISAGAPAPNKTLMKKILFGQNKITRCRDGDVLRFAGSEKSDSVHSQNKQALNK